MDNELFEVGSRVTVLPHGCRKQRRAATVLHYNPETEWYFVQFEEGQPWRGHYKRSELEETK